MSPSVTVELHPATGAGIRSLRPDELPTFFAYLGRQLAANGKDGHPLFQPVSREVNSFPPEKYLTFAEGMSIPVGELHWRRAWVAVDENDMIVGHADLRSHGDLHTAHRALLGMGLLRSHFRRGIGRQLLGFTLEWAMSARIIEYIDLSVLSGNVPAISLYEAAGFQRVCELTDMFRIDGKSESEIMMTRWLRSVESA